MTFGASDMPLNAARPGRAWARAIPDRGGRHRRGREHRRHQERRLTLDGPTLARIFLGEIRSWNHAALRKLNPGAKLPSQPIVVVRRSDGSGTTFVFTDYLAKMSQEWRSRIGSITSVEWPVGVGARGNEGVVGSGRAHQGRDRLRRIRLCQAEQARLHHADQQGRQGGRAHHRLVRRRRRQRQLGRRSRLRRDPDQRSRRGDLADHQRDVRAHAQAAERSGRRQRGVEILRLGLCQRRQDGRGARLRSDAAGRGRRGPQSLWASEIKDASGAPVYASK